MWHHVVSRQCETPAQLWSLPNQPVEIRGCARPHSFPVHACPDALYEEHRASHNRGWQPRIVRFLGVGDIVHPLIVQDEAKGGFVSGDEAGNVVVHQEEVVEDLGVEAPGAGREEALDVPGCVLPEALGHELLQMLQAELVASLMQQRVESAVVALALEES